jgi:hypothetical protein
MADVRRVYGVCVCVLCRKDIFPKFASPHLLGLGTSQTNKFYPTKNKTTRTTWGTKLSCCTIHYLLQANDPHQEKSADMMLTFLVLQLLLLQYSNTCCDAAFTTLSSSPSPSPSLSLSSLQFRRPPFVSILQERPDYHHHHHPYQRPHGTTRATTASNHDDDSIIQKLDNDDDSSSCSSLQLPYTAPGDTATTTTTKQQRSSSSHHNHNIRETIRRTWMDQSIQYYSKVIQMRLPQEEEHRSSSRMTTTTILSPPPHESDTTSSVYTPEFVGLAKQHYFALRKIKDGKPHHAEQIYRRILKELVRDNDDDDSTVQCDHAQLAVTTLLLALHLQRTGDSKATRSVFLHFFRTIVMTTTTTTTTDSSSQYRDNYIDADPHTNRTTTTIGGTTTPPHCACSAKVLQAFALFEMKQGNTMKSFELVCLAIQFDPTLQPILNWKQFRDVQQRWRQRRRHTTTTTTSSHATSSHQ